MNKALSDSSERAFADALQTTIIALDSFHHTLTTFLPRYLLDLAPVPGESHGELLEGSFIFADVTGFTALTGELSKRGTAGREEMNRLMRALFAALLDPLLASGGDLLFFAGDAALACFPALPNARDAQLAARTALRLVRAIIPFASFETPYGTFSLTMSAGIERGQALAAVVGTRRRMELLISGGPVQGATAAEGQAEPGQVFAGSGILPFLDPEAFKLRGGIVEGLRNEELDDYESIPPTRRRRRLSAVVSRHIPDLIEHLEQVLDMVETLIPFIPLDLVQQIAQGQDIRQHPPVAIQFVNILGIEDLGLGAAGPALATSVLQRYFVQAQQVVTDREGIISQVDPYAHGFTLLNPFGAPTHHEGVPRLATSTALELGRVLERVNSEFALDPPLTQRIGLTYDRIFTGEIGYRHRREYVVAGPAVNLAARLMGKAEPGHIVLDTAAWEAVHSDFVSDSLPPIPLKGIPAPVPRYAVRGLRPGRGLDLADYPLLGRQEDMANLEKRLDEAIAGRGKALAIIGEAGIGKSRLVAALEQVAREKGVTVLAGRCRPFARTTPYSPWAGLVDQWFELDEEAELATRRQQLRERLAQFDLVASLPAFADLLDLPSPRSITRESTAPTQQNRGLFAAVRQQAKQEPADPGQLAALLSQRVAEQEAGRPDGQPSAPSIWQIVRERASIPHALHLLLERQAGRQPTLVIIEDLQWMDADSHHVLEEIVATIAEWPLLLLITARPETDWSGERVQLLPLSDVDSRALAALALRATGVAPDLAAWLFERTAGNPLFTMSYCRELRDSESIAVDPAGGLAHWSGPPPQIPLSLQELLLAQVERLGELSRETTQRSAVIGAVFTRQLLTHMSQVLSEEQLDTSLDQMARQAIIAPPPPGRTHIFSSQSLHDAVYTALSHALRQDWHEQVGDYLAEADAATLYERLEQLAHHYSHGRDPFKAAHFTRLAGDKARARQANDAALAFYDQTLSVSDRSAKVAVERLLAHEGTGDVYALQAETASARQAYQNAMEAAGPGDGPRLRAKLAMLLPNIAQDLEPLEAARQEIAPSDLLQHWLGAALVWQYAARGEKETAATLCQDLLPGAKDPVTVALGEAGQKLAAGEPLPPYADLYALFARSYLRLPLGGGS